MIDLIDPRRSLKLTDLKIVVLDEADRMLDIGFRPDIERILTQLPRRNGRRCCCRRRCRRRWNGWPTGTCGIRSGSICRRRRVGSDTIDQYYISVDPDRKFQVLRQTAVDATAQAGDRVHPHQARRGEAVSADSRTVCRESAFIHGDLQQTHPRPRDEEIPRREHPAADRHRRHGPRHRRQRHLAHHQLRHPAIDCDDYVHRVGRTGRMSSAYTRGTAFTFVCKDEGDQLTNIEIRIDKVLEEYEVPGVVAVHQKKIRQHVNDLPSPFAPRIHTEDEEFGVVA